MRSILRMPIANGDNKKTASIIVSVVVLSFFAFHNFYKANFFAIIGIIIWCSACFFLSIPNFFKFCILLVPSTSWLKFVNHPNAIFGYVFLLFALRYLFCRQKLHGFSLNIVLHAILVFITSMLYSDFSLLSSLIRFLIFIIIAADLFTINKSNEFKLDCLSCFCIGEFLNVIFGIMFSNKENLMSHYFGGFRDDRNYFAAVISVAIIVALYLIFYHRKNYLYCFLPIMLYAGLLSQSRTFVLSLIFSLIMVICSLCMKRSNYKVLILIALGLVLFILFYDNILSLLHSLGLRFEEENVATGNSRFEAWEYYIRIAVSTPVRFLVGSGRSTNYLTASFDIVEHNTFIQAFFTVGILGTITLIGCYAKLFRIISPEKGKTKMFAYLPLFTTIFVYSSINALYSDLVSVLFIICFIVIDIEKANRKIGADMPIGLK